MTSIFKCSKRELLHLYIEGGKTIEALSTVLKEKYHVSENKMCFIISDIQRNLIPPLNKRWAESSRKKDSFFKKNRNWLDSEYLVFFPNSEEVTPDFTPSTSASGKRRRPCISYGDSMMEVTMAKNNNENNSQKDNILEDMLSFKLGEDTVSKIIFEESDEELLPDVVEDITPSLDKQNIIPPGINNVIILGTKRKNKAEKTTKTKTLNKAVNIKTEIKTVDQINCEIDSFQHDVSLDIRERHKDGQQKHTRNENKENTERFRPNQLVSIPAENMNYFQNECVDPVIPVEANMKKKQNVNEFTSEKSTADRRDKISEARNLDNLIKNKNVQNLEINSHYVALQKSVLNEEERETFVPKKIVPIYTKENIVESTYQNERTVTPYHNEITETLLIPKTRVEEDDLTNKPKRIKRNFPRTKVTSKREVKKYPGKMEAMRYHSEASKVKISHNPVTSAADKNVSQTDDSNKCSMNNNNSNVNLQDPYILAMLTAAAENLLAIFPSLDTFVTANKTDEVYKKVESEFYQLKYDFFQLSYASTISIIIPNKDNKTFLKEFYDLAANLAKKKQTLHFTIFRFEVLCNELIRWTQNKQKKIENLHTYSINQKPSQAPKSTDKNNKELSKRLLTPPKPLSQIPDKPSIEILQHLQAPPKNLGQIPKNPSIELLKYLQAPPNPLNHIPDKPSIEASVPKPKNNFSTSVCNYKLKTGPPGREIEITYSPQSQPQTRALNVANNQNHRNSNPAAASINNISGHNFVKQPNIAIEKNNQTQPIRNNMTVPLNILYANTTVNRIPNLVPNTVHQPYQTRHTSPNTSISISSNNTTNPLPNTAANQINYMDSFIESVLKTNDNEAPKDKAKRARCCPSQSARKDALYRANNSSVANQYNSYQMGGNIMKSQNTVYRPPPPYPMPTSQTNQIYQNDWNRSHPFQNSYQTPLTNHEYLYRNVTLTQQYSKTSNTPVLPQERSSVSRDSGFMSPLGECNNMLEQLEPHMDTSLSSLAAGASAVEPQQQMSGVPFPVITHVTSLDPNATHYPHGKCQVCNTVTLNRCLACNLSYYCQFKCQEYDWPIHRTYCRGYLQNTNP